MVIFLAGFSCGQGALPASRRVFHAPLTARKTGDTGPSFEMMAQSALAQLAKAIQQMAARSDRKRQFAAQSGMRLGSEPERARLKLTHPWVRNALSANQFFGASCRKLWCLFFAKLQ
ncbi:hypothetical protein GC169_03810 [bacterium]|nr:hypothetical protein [bacterium]